MTLSDEAVARLRQLADWPELPTDRYEVHALLGRGGMGAVYRVHDRRLGRDVAVKVLATDTAGPDTGARLRREARVLARLEHPGIVPVHDAGDLPDGRTYYVMQLVRGARLDDHARGLGSERDLLRVLERVCDAVAFAHSRGVIHRDLKPGNVMVGPFGEVLVLDWGVAKTADLAPADAGAAVLPPESVILSAAKDPSARAPSASDDPLTRDGDVLGTPGFMAPEQARGDLGQVDARTDVFALGAMLRTLVAARGAALAPPLAAIVAKATAVDPDARYAGAAALGDDLRRYLDHERVTAFREPFGARVARVYARHRTAILLVATYLVVRIVILLARGI